MPSCGKAISWSSTRSRSSSRSSISARSAVRDGSQTSTCERISPVPWATSQQDRLAGPRLDVLVGQGGLPLGPGLDALDERPGLVVARLADGQDGVQVDVRIDERRGEEPACGVELAAAVGGDRAGRRDGRDRDRPSTDRSTGSTGRPSVGWTRALRTMSPDVATGTSGRSGNPGAVCCGRDCRRQETAAGRRTGPPRRPQPPGVIVSTSRPCRRPRGPADGRCTGACRPRRT